MTYAIVAVVAVFVCIFTYGWDVIRPSSLALYHQWGDGMQHYFGWVAFRQSRWDFPIGCFDGATYPDATSIIFTDSLPIVAVIFKLFRGWIPHDFQYFGIWALLCYILQGVLALKLLLRFLKEPFSRDADEELSASCLATAVFGAILFLFVPSLVIRQFAHEALGGQWILLLAWDVFLDIAAKEQKKKICFKSALLGFLAAGTHIYFLPLCGMILVGALCLNLVVSAVSILVYLLTAVFTVWIFGGFSVAAEVVNVDFTFGNNANLNTLINPLTYSAFFGGLPLTHQGQDDGSGYLGLGIFVILLLDGIIFAIRRAKGEDKTFDKERGRRLIGALGLILIMTMAFSTYPFLSVNGRVILSTKLTGPMDALMSVFRCNGRGIWVISYGVMIFGAGLLLRQRNLFKKLLPGLLCLCLLLQVADLSPLLTEKQKKVHPEDIEVSRYLYAEELNALIQSGEVSHVVLTESVSGIPSLFVSCWAIDNGLTVNRFYLARSDEEAYAKRTKEALDSPQPDTLYLFAAEAADEMEGYGLSPVLKTDGFAVGRRLP